MASLHTFPPTEQVYESFVPGKFSGLALEKYFATRFTYLKEEDWAELIREGKITLNGKTVQPGHRVKERDRTKTRMEPRSEPPADRSLEIVYQDRDLRIFNKAAPIPVHPSGRYFKNSMTELLKEVYPEETPRPVQRLDATTTGLIVFARSRKVAACMMGEFQQNRVQKVYLAIVEGRPIKERFVIESPIGKTQSSKRETGQDILHAKSALTEVEWIHTLGGRSLLKVMPRSGRTNQIRVHLASVGHPVYNDAVYGRGEPDVCQFGLHAYKLRFNCLGRELAVVARYPDHFKPYLEGKTETI